jgi:head-tail adaptor
MTISANPGLYRHVVEIQESTRTRGDQGTQIDTFATIATRRASVREDADDKFTIEMRYFDGLIPTAKKLLDEDGNKISVNRLKHGTRILNIEDVLDMRAMKQIVRVICTRDDETF